MQRLIRRKHSFFTADTQIPVPWGIDISIPGLNVAIEASENHPINGRKSLRLKTPAHYCRVVSNSFIMQDTAKFYFRIRGKEKSLGELTLLCYKQLRNYRPVAISLLPVRILQDNQIMECAFTFNPAEYGVKGQYFRLILSINAGEIFFDDVMVINTTAGK